MRNRCRTILNQNKIHVSNHQFSHKNDSPSQTAYLSEISLHLVHHFTTLRPAIMLLQPTRWIPGSDSVGQALGGLQTSNSWGQQAEILKKQAGWNKIWVPSVSICHDLHDLVYRIGWFLLVFVCLFVFVLFFALLGTRKHIPCLLSPFELMIFRLKPVWRGYVFSFFGQG